MIAIPKSVETEEMVIATLLSFEQALLDISDILFPECFTEPKYKKLFEILLGMHQESEVIDIITITKKLREQNILDVYGGPYGVTKMTDKAVSASGIQAHARILVEYWMRRELVSLGQSAESSAKDDTNDVFNIIDSIDSVFQSITRHTSKKQSDTFRDVYEDLVRDIESTDYVEGQITGIDTGLKDLNKVTHGWQNSDLIIVAARPGMGKTGFLLKTIKSSAKKGIPIAVFSLEMGAKQLVSRMVSEDVRIPATVLAKKALSEYEKRMLRDRNSDQSFQQIKNLPVHIDDSPNLSILEIKSKSRRLKKEHGIGLIAVDYLQLMSGKNPQHREQEIASISRGLKHIAKELDIPVIALSQLSRSVETRGGDKRPQLSDLRESGAIEQDADMIMFLYRPEYYGITEDEEGTPTHGVSEIIIAKHRNGSLETVKARFVGKYTTFRDMDDDEAFLESKKIAEYNRNQVFDRSGNNFETAFDEDEFLKADF